MFRAVCVRQNPEDFEQWQIRVRSQECIAPFLEVAGIYEHQPNRSRRFRHTFLQWQFLLIDVQLDGHFLAFRPIFAAFRAKVALSNSTRAVLPEHFT
jgi:hypothetical protein